MCSLSLTLLSALALQAAAVKLPPLDSDRQEQTIRNVRQYAAHLDRLSCSAVAASTGAKTVTVEFAQAAHHGAPSKLDSAALIKDVFEPSSQADFKWDHWATIGSKKIAVFDYSYQVNGKLHAGSIYADESTGALSRITFRGSDAPAHLFCSANSQ